MVNTSTPVKIKIYIERFCRAGANTLHSTVKIQGLKRHFEMKNIGGKLVLY
jgi:hypothetical protein